jgi:hypothetical protein
MTRILSIDCESNGLWGEIFAIGATVLASDGTIQATFGAKISLPEYTEWVKENVLLGLLGMREYPCYTDLLKEFGNFYHIWKKNAAIICHMGYIVEARLLRDMHDAKIIDDFGGPYPFHDVAGNLDQAGHDPTSVDKYFARMVNDGHAPAGMRIRKHHPIDDALVAALVYRDLKFHPERHAAG